MDMSTTSDELMGMATALSIDQWHPSKESKCEYEEDSSLSVNFLCMQPKRKAAKKGDAPAPAPEPPPDKPTAARCQEIFVDLLGMNCVNLDAASPRHILDDRFDSFLNQGERDFKDSLMNFLSQQTNDAKETRAYQYLEQMLRSQMGYRNTYFWSNRKNYGRTKIKDMLSSLLMPGTIHNNTNQHNGVRVSASPPAIADDPGHVFVCNASVCDIQCDAFLCPASIAKVKGRLTGTIARQWRLGTLQQNKVLSEHIMDDPFSFTLYPDHSRVVTLMDWPWTELLTASKMQSASPVPLVVFGEVSLEKSQEFAAMPKGTKRGVLPPEKLHVLALLETVRQFLDVAMMELSEHQPNPNCYHQRYLLALPILGTGGGFAGDLMGLIVEQLLSLLVNYVNEKRQVDVVLVCADEATYTHAQTLRQGIYQQDCLRQKNEEEGILAASGTEAANTITLPCFQKLDSEQKEGALRLARLASTRHLSLFLGAGVSIGSGLPSWFGLLHLIEDMFTPTGSPSERTLGDNVHWDPLAMADKLDECCNSRKDRQGEQFSLKQRVCNHLRDNGKRPGLLLSLLISLPCHSMVTLNYDQLIEKACRNWNITTDVSMDDEIDSKKRLSVIPYKPVRNSHYWLLKMHGCVVAPNEIILTSKDYAAYDSSRSKALAGLVQASLMTKHLLFVGFSLSDPNYLKIIDQVRQALRPYSEY